MRKIFLSMALVTLIGAPVALAQSGGGSPPPSRSRARRLRRSATASRASSDVPNEKNIDNPNDLLSKENAALDKKLKSICRGC